MPGTRVAVIGANGQLGTDLVDVFSDWDLVPLTHADIEVCDFVHARQILERAKPDIVINTAAFVRVDDCEDEASKAFWINAFAVRNLAHVCADLNTMLVHISTDYVFDGKKREPYTEEDLPNPINVYGASKLAGEHFVQAICPKHLIIRTSGLYGRAGSSGKGGNFVETMVRLAEEGKPIRVVDDQRLAPTYTRDLAQKVEGLLLQDSHGLLHLASAGECSWFQFAEMIFRQLGLTPDLKPITTAELGARAARPVFSVLAYSAWRGGGLPGIRTWDKALQDYVSQIR